MLSGSSWWSMSMPVSAISAQVTSSAQAAAAAEAEMPCHPRRKDAGGEFHQRDIAARSCVWQAAQRPRRISQLITGMFCHALIGALQTGQAERGVLKPKRSAGADGDACVAALRPTATARAAWARHSRSSMMGSR